LEHGDGREGEKFSTNEFEQKLGSQRLAVCFVFSNII